MTDLLPTRIPGNPLPTCTQRLVLVEDPDAGTIRVRWKLRDARWWCEKHGAMDRADCVHTFAAAIRLADVVLGLNPIAPTGGTTDDD